MIGTTRTQRWRALTTRMCGMCRHCRKSYGLNALAARLGTPPPYMTHERFRRAFDRLVYQHIKECPNPTTRQVATSLGMTI